GEEGKPVEIDYKVEQIVEEEEDDDEKSNHFPWWAILLIVLGAILLLLLLCCCICCCCCRNKKESKTVKEYVEEDVDESERMEKEMISEVEETENANKMKQHASQYKQQDDINRMITKEPYQKLPSSYSSFSQSSSQPKYASFMQPIEIADFNSTPSFMKPVQSPSNGSSCTKPPDTTSQTHQLSQIHSQYNPSDLDLSVTADRHLAYSQTEYHPSQQSKSQSPSFNSSSQMGRPPIPKLTITPVAQRQFKKM
ncbi:MAG: hypothetical protein EZS28_044291, partial [Streblomastix strix]